MQETGQMICMLRVCCEEQELANNFAEENSEEFSEPDEVDIYMIFIRDSLLQFDLIIRQDDYEP